MNQRVSISHVNESEGEHMARQWIRGWAYGTSMNQRVPSGQEQESKPASHCNRTSEAHTTCTRRNMQAGRPPKPARSLQLTAAAACLNLCWTHAAGVLIGKSPVVAAAGAQPQGSSSKYMQLQTCLFSKSTIPSHPLRPGPHRRAMP